MDKINRKRAAEMILNSGGQILTVDFTKRSTGEVRSMNCRLGVKSYLHGGQLAYNPAEHRLITVFDMQKQGYRSVAIEGIHRLAINGAEYRVSD